MPSITPKPVHPLQPKTKDAKAQRRQDAGAPIFASSPLRLCFRTSTGLPIEKAGATPSKPADRYGLPPTKRSDLSLLLKRKLRGPKEDGLRITCRLIMRDLSQDPPLIACSQNRALDFGSSEATRDESGYSMGLSSAKTASKRGCVR